MDLGEYVKNLKKHSKRDDIPGMVLGESDRECPLCGRKMKLYRPCCGSPSGYIGCTPCGYKINQNTNQTPQPNEVVQEQ